MLSGRTTHLTLDLALPPDAVRHRLASGMDHVRSLLFSVTWGLRGKFVGNVEGDGVQMRVRHGYSNGYTRLLFGRIQSLPRGSRLRVEFRDVRFVVLLMNAAALVLFGVGAWHYLRFGEPEALAGPAVTLLAFLVVEIIGRRLGRQDEAAMRRHLTRMFEDVSIRDGAPS